MSTQSPDAENSNVGVGVSVTREDESTELLRRRVDLLELDSHERRKPWYRQPSNVFSAMALCVAVGTTAYTQSSSKQESIRSKKEELRKLVIDLLQLEGGLIGSPTTLPGGSDPLASAKLGVYLQAAERLVDTEIPNEVSSYEYAVLGNDQMLAGNVVKAERYLSKAASTASTPIDRAQAFRFLGALYFAPSQLHDPDKGRKVFEQANEG